MEKTIELINESLLEKKKDWKKLGVRRKMLENI